MSPMTRRRRLVMRPLSRAIYSVMYVMNGRRWRIAIILHFKVLVARLEDWNGDGRITSISWVVQTIE